MTLEHGTLGWFSLRDEREFLVGVAMRPVVGPGYERVLDMARDVNGRPHDRTSSDQLDLECREMAEAMIVIAQEDGHSRSLAGVLRAMLLHAVRTPDPANGQES